MRSRKRLFIQAFCWMFGSSEKHASEVYETAHANENYEYLGAIIDAYENNAKKAFYCD